MRLWEEVPLPPAACPAKASYHTGKTSHHNHVGEEGKEDSGQHGTCLCLTT